MKKLLLLILIGVGIGYAVRTWVLEQGYVASASMEPTLKLESKFMLNKLVYRFRKPRRNEIIVFASPYDEKQLIKRVIAVAGDEVEIRDKKLWLNGTEMEEPYVVHSRPGERFRDDFFGPYVVPEETVFVMGDNRDESNDGRNWTDPQTGEITPFLSNSSVKGKIFEIYYKNTPKPRRLNY
jgi:signal peptidase I